MDDLEREIELAVKIGSVLEQMFDENNENYAGKITQADLPAFFHAITMAGAHLYAQITGDNKNFLEFNQLQNSLCFQFMDKAKD